MKKIVNCSWCLPHSDLVVLTLQSLAKYLAGEAQAYHGCYVTKRLHHGDFFSVFFDVL